MDPAPRRKELRAPLEGNEVEDPAGGERGERTEGDHGHGGRGPGEALEEGRDQEEEGVPGRDQGDSRGGGLQGSRRQDGHGPVLRAERPGGGPRGRSGSGFGGRRGRGRGGGAGGGLGLLTSPVAVQGMGSRLWARLLIPQVCCCWPLSPLPRRGGGWLPRSLRAEVSSTCSTCFCTF